MADVAIVGAGIGGLMTALLLGREGVDLVVCERDPAPVPDTTEEMWSSWPRTGIPQWRLGHTFLSGFRHLLAERAPDVLERLLASGAPLVDFSDWMPGAERIPEDAELASVMCRRPVLEGILRRVVEAEPTVELRRGCEVVGLTAGPSGIPGTPGVTGLRLRDAPPIPARTVVITGGRLVPVRRWLEAIGAAPPAETSEGCGVVCFSRFFRIRLRPGEDHTIASTIAVERTTDCMEYEIFGADAATFCVELAPPSYDRALRALRRESTHLAVARSLPEIGDWLDDGRSTPIGTVAAMGEEQNLLRRFVVDGKPLAVDLHVIGDARCQLNSLYAWGCGVAASSAVTLVDILREHPGDGVAQALAFEQRLGPEIDGRHRFSLARDRALGRRFRGEPEPVHPAGSYGSIVGTVLPAAEDDPEIFRAYMRWELQLDPVGSLEADSALLERARDMAKGRAPSAPGPAELTRARVLEIIAATA